MKISKAVTYLTTSSGLRQSVLVLFGNGLSAALAALAMIIYSRLLGPVEFGVFSIGYSILQFITRLSDGGVHIAVQKLVASCYRNQPQEAATIAVAGSILKLGLSLVTAVGFWILAPVIGRQWLRIEQFDILRTAVVVSFAMVVFEYVAVILQSIHDFWHFVVISVVQGLVKFGVALWWWFWGLTNAGVALVSFAVAQLVGVGLGVYYLPNWIFKARLGEKKAFRAVWNISKFTSVAIIAAAFGDNIDVLLVKAYLPLYETGLFAAGVRLSLVLSLVAFSLGTVLASRVAQYQSIRHMRMYLRKSWLLVFGSLGAIALVVPLSKILILVTAGPEYVAATPAVAYLMAAGMIVVATTPLVAVFYAIDRPEYFAASGILQTVVLVGASLYLIPVNGIIGAAMAKLLARLVVFGFTVCYVLLAVNKRFNLSIRNQLNLFSRLESGS